MPSDGRRVVFAGRHPAYKHRHGPYTPTHAWTYIRRQSAHRIPNARRDSTRSTRIHALRM